MRFLPFAVFALVFAGCAGSGASLSAPGCNTLVLDLEHGTLNGVAPTATRAQIATQFPCATGDTEDGAEFNFGGGVFFLDHDFYMYTHRDYIEVRADFAGAVVPAVLCVSVHDLADAFGAPVRTEDGAQFYVRDYGCLRAELSPDADVVVELGVHAEACDDVILPR
ncbi:MAG: hypothetical protein R3284_06670 [Rubricoccaceae bacterium]|nr:hypothetical protein [Rubricoccaceae bacterium]